MGKYEKTWILKTNKKNLPEIFKNILKNEGQLPEFCKEFEKFLDGLLSEDFFGTEGQCDPRGDRRG